MLAVIQQCFFLSKYSEGSGSLAPYTPGNFATTELIMGKIMMFIQYDEI